MYHDSAEAEGGKKDHHSRIIMHAWQRVRLPTMALPRELPLITRSASALYLTVSLPHRSHACRSRHLRHRATLTRLFDFSSP